MINDIIKPKNCVVAIKFVIKEELHVKRKGKK